MAMEHPPVIDDGPMDFPSYKPSLTGDKPAMFFFRGCKKPPG
jgi:hypothetical protein